MTNEEENRINEISRIVAKRIGRDIDSNGQIRDEHLRKILYYLIRTETENYQVAMSILALMCGMSIRNVRENYMMGLEHLKFFETYLNSGQKHYRWTFMGNIDDKRANVEMCVNCALKPMSEDCVNSGCNNLKAETPKPDNIEERKKPYKEAKARLKVEPSTQFDEKMAEMQLYIAYVSNCNRVNERVKTFDEWITDKHQKIAESEKS